MVLKLQHEKPEQNFSGKTLRTTGMKVKYMFHVA